MSTGTGNPQPPGVPLLLAVTGPGSRDSIEQYVRTVIEQRTTPNEDTSAEQLARSLVTSILSRLGADFPVATGGAQAQQKEKQ